MVIGESRSELLSWLNQTLCLDYTKVEQCGTGAAYCQLIDSIYADVPMGKVKFDANLSVYDTRSNMKILQVAFNKHNITKLIDTERLIKCRLQDNLELLQWFKRYWMDHKDINVNYDPQARRRGLGGVTLTPKADAMDSPSSRRNTLANAPPMSRQSRVSSAGSRSTSSGSLSVQKRRVASSSLPATSYSESRPSEQARLAEISEELARAREEVKEYKIMTDTLETERNFYFNKLREIEILSRSIQAQHDREDATAKQVQLLGVLDVLEQIQGILYSTEKGFEVQDCADAESF